MSDAAQTTTILDDGIIDVNGMDFMPDAKGSLVPLALIKPQHKLEDEIVRKVISFASDLSARINRFKGHTQVDLGMFDAMLAQEYEVSKGGKKGNCTYQTFDGLQKVVVQVSTHFDFGPELHTAKTLIDECINEWSEDGRPELQAIVKGAFNTDKEGEINRSEIFKLLRLNIEDERWMRAMDAIRNAMHETGSKEYIRFYQRDDIKDEWKSIKIDLAKV